MNGTDPTPDVALRLGQPAGARVRLPFRKWRIVVPALVVAAIVLGLATAAHAATIVVTTTADDNTPNDGSVSLREAIQAMNNGSAGADTDISNQNPGVFGSNDA